MLLYFVGISQADRAKGRKIEVKSLQYKTDLDFVTIYIYMTGSHTPAETNHDRDWEYIDTAGEVGGYRWAGVSGVGGIKESQTNWQTEGKTEREIKAKKTELHRHRGMLHVDSPTHRSREKRRPVRPQHKKKRYLQS